MSAKKNQFTERQVMTTLPAAMQAGLDFMSKEMTAMQAEIKDELTKINDALLRLDEKIENKYVRREEFLVEITSIKEDLKDNKSDSGSLKDRAWTIIVAVIVTVITIVVSHVVTGI